jgi:hypothetical protein
VNMYKGKSHIVTREMLVGHLVGRRYSYIGLVHFTCVGAKVGIDIDTKSGEIPIPSGIRMIGGQGVILDGRGISFGKCAGQMWIQTLWFW